MALRDWNQISTHRIALDEYYAYARQQAQPWHEAVKTYEEDYFLEQVTADGESKRTDLKDIVDQYVNVLENSRLRISMSRPGNSMVDREKAEAGEKYLNHVFDAIDQRKGYKIRTRLLHNMLAKSAGILHWRYLPNPVPGLEDVISPYHVPPVDMDVVDPLNFMPVLGGPLGQFQYVLHVEQMALESVLQMLDTTFEGPHKTQALEELLRWFPNSNAAEGVYERRETKDTLINYWGWHNVGGKWVVFNAVKYGSAVLRPFTPMPGYKVLPWAVAVAQDTGHPELRKRWLPVTYSAREHVRRLERQQNRIDLLLEKLADEPYVFQKSANSGANPSIAADGSYVLTLEDGEQFRSPQYGQLSPDFWRRISDAEVQLEKSSLPNTMFGGGGGAESMTSWDKSNEGGRLRFIRPRDALVFGYAQAIRGIMSFIFTLHQTEPIYTTTLHKQNKEVKVVLTGADLAPATWEVAVELDTRLPGDETRNMTLATMAVGSKLMSMRRARERWLSIDDPQTEEEQIMLEAVMATDQRISSAYAYKVLYNMDALPDLTGEQYMEIWNTMEAIRQRGKLLGVPDAQIEAYLDKIRMGLKAELHNRSLMTGAAPMGGPPSTPSAPQDPALGGALAPNGAMMQQSAGFAPPGNASDPGTPFRDFANQLNGSVGQRQ